MSRIFIKQIKSTIELDQDGAQLIVDALLSYANSLVKEKPDCQCNFCIDPKQRARKILDIYFDTYPLSKVAKNAIGIPSLRDIEEAIESHKQRESQAKAETSTQASSPESAIRSEEQ